MKEIIARPGEVIVEQGDCIITSYALGSSLGICLYDATHQIGGYVHSILPNSPITSRDSKYVDDAIHMLYEAMQTWHIGNEHLSAKIVGGAKLFQFPKDETADIGKANIQVAREVLKVLKIPIAHEDIGDQYGRSIHFHLETGLVYVETKNKYVYHI